MLACTLALVSGMLGFEMAKKAPEISAHEAAVQARIVSPEVHPDRTVTFRLKAPKAEKVEVGVEAVMPNTAMAKGADGVWTLTTKPLAPDLYGYGFSVDGVGMLDPSNPVIKPNLIWVSNMVLVPGEKPQDWEVQDVPHGALQQRFYKSGVIGDHRDVFVYTPPGYDPAGSKKYPVLYLLHGFSDTAVGWTAVGQAHTILDNLIAQKRAQPMLVVMPLGYGVPDFGKNGKLQFGLALENFGKFRQGLLEEVIPMVEKNYRVSNRREDRAIAGLSMGGAETLFTGLHNPDKFAYVGAFSTGGFGPTQIESVFGSADPKRLNDLKAFWMVCGTEDGLIGFQRGFSKWLSEKGVKHEAEETSGGHWWTLWRRNLATFAEKIFK
jgi:enterochelin esterase-like enzyme